MSGEQIRTEEVKSMKRGAKAVFIDFFEYLKT